MTKESFQSILGKELKTARRKRRLTQAGLAETSNLSRPTIRLLENGHGTLASLQSVLEALGVVVAGRNLPVRAHLGESLAILRKRRCLSQRTLAGLAGVTPPTISALETAFRGRVETLNRVLAILGAGAYLASKDAPRRFYTHAGTSSVHHAWETPPALLEMLYEAVGPFDLDPCSPSRDARLAPVRARIYFTAEDDGLSLPWFGRVFVNPPYGRTIGLWTAKAREEAAAGSAGPIVGLLPARTDTAWWHRDIARAADVFLLRGRLSFGPGGNSASFPPALAVWGADPAVIRKLRTLLPDAWFLAREDQDVSGPKQTD